MGAGASPKTRNGQISTSTNDLDVILDAMNAESQGLSYGTRSFLGISAAKNRLSKTYPKRTCCDRPTLSVQLTFTGAGAAPKTRNGQISTSANDLDLILDATDAESQGFSYGTRSFLVISAAKNRF